MNDLNLKSQHPVVHDNTEEDIILIPPSVLDCKLRDFESFTTARASIAQDVALAVAFLAPVVSSDFRFFFGFSGETIKGIFAALAVVMIIKSLYDATIMLMKWRSHNRAAVIRSLHGHVEQNGAIIPLIRSMTSKLKREVGQPNDQKST